MTTSTIQHIDSSPLCKDNGPRINTALRFYHEILGLEHLHYGLWENDPFNMKGLKTAQERYSDHLLSYFPESTKTILDVGAGTGATTEKIQAHGYDIEALSPDPYQQHLFKNKRHIIFNLCRFQDFKPRKKYDLILMSESCQYIPMNDLFKNAKVCAPAGYLLINDYFVTKPDNTVMSKSGHNMSLFYQKARDHHFELIKEEDITDQTAVSLDLAKSWIDHYIVPSIDLLTYSFGRKHPKLFKLISWLMRNKLKKLNDQIMLLDSEHFKRVKRYKIMLFKVPG
ncbi:MAG: class I SAM-dependent methyltransferase [Gammaproteobacteria bacterium]|nr:class I SAM-dependent methyltransferase [Gammaproteobacteria bacterium]